MVLLDILVQVDWPRDLSTLFCVEKIEVHGTEHLERGSMPRVCPTESSWRLSERLDLLSVGCPHFPEHLTSGLDTLGLPLTVLDQRKPLRVESSGAHPFHACGFAGALQCIHRPVDLYCGRPRLENVTCAMS